MKVAVVIPTINRCESLSETLESLSRQTETPEIYVVDNASTDGTKAMVASHFPAVHLVRNETNLGFGGAIDRVALGLDCDVLVLVNNDVVCDPRFVQLICEPFADEHLGMVAGVLLQAATPDRIDSAGVELDTTLGSWDFLWNRPVDVLAEGVGPPFGPCGGAAAYRLAAFQELGGFDHNLFAYWEDVDLAIRFRQAGWRCALAAGATALHKHTGTLGASPAQRRLHAFGRGYILGKYGVMRDPRTRLKVSALDWPTLLVHLVARREAGPIRERRRGLRLGRAHRVSSSLPSMPVSFGEALARQTRFLRLRLRRRLPRHFYKQETPSGV